MENKALPTGEYASKLYKNAINSALFFSSLAITASNNEAMATPRVITSTEFDHLVLAAVVGFVIGSVSSFLAPLRRNDTEQQLATIRNWTFGCALASSALALIR